MNHRRLFASLALATLASLASAPAADLAFPGAVGHGAATAGGRGGKILRVTTLAAEGPGSFAEAVRATGPRIVVFEVGGVIDLKGRSIKISQPFLTIAGQTAPAPGITLVQGGLGLSTHDVVIQHIAIRPGSMGKAKKSGWEVDGLSGIGAHHILIDHCSFTWATDENLSASGERFKGGRPEEWWQNTSHHVTFSNCIVAEGLSNSTHGKGEHSKGSLLHDNTRFITVTGNLYASNMERNPLIKGGAQAVIVNNWIFNPGRHAVHAALSEGEWKGHEWQTAHVALVGNVLEHGPDTQAEVALFKRHGKTPVELYMRDNLAVDRAGKPVELTREIAAPAAATLPAWAGHFEALAATTVKEQVAKNAGARPWDRDPVDQRIVSQALAGKGAIVDHEDEVGGYPVRPQTRAAFVEAEWNLETLERR